MRKVLVGIGAVAVLVAIAGAIAIFGLARGPSALDREAKTYLDGSMVAITTRWDKNELWTRASPTLRSMIAPDDLREQFQAAAMALGPLLQYRGADGQATVAGSNTQTKIFANYVAKASFQKGDAEFRIVLIKVGSAWMIDGFHFRSPVLTRNSAGARS